VHLRLLTSLHAVKAELDALTGRIVGMPDRCDFLQFPNGIIGKLPTASHYPRARTGQFWFPSRKHARTGGARSAPHSGVSGAVKAQPNRATWTILIAIAASCRSSDPCYSPEASYTAPGGEALADTLMVGQARDPRRSYADRLCFPFRDRLVHSLQSSTPKLLRFTVVRYPIGPDPGIALRPNGNMPFPHPILIFVLAAKHGKVGKAIVESHRL
jgi:hypothetical protein